MIRPATMKAAAALLMMALALLVTVAACREERAPDSGPLAPQPLPLTDDPSAPPVTP